MSDLEPSELVFPLFVGIIALLAFSYLVSLIARISPLRAAARHNKLVKGTLSLVLGFMVCIFFFLATTRLVAETDLIFPPHGVVSGTWDFVNYPSGAGFMDEKTRQVLILDDSVLQYISRERYLRYLRPPFLRHDCFTGHIIACRWADIDLVNFDDKQEWIDYLVRLMVGIASGVVTVIMASRHTESKEALQLVKAGKQCVLRTGSVLS